MIQVWSEMQNGLELYRDGKKQGLRIEVGMIGQSTSAYLSKGLVWYTTACTVGDI